MSVGRTAGDLSVVSGSELLVMFVILDDEDPARNFGERLKIIKIFFCGGGLGKGSIRRNRKIFIRLYLRETFREK